MATLRIGAPALAITLLLGGCGANAAHVAPQHGLVLFGSSFNKQLRVVGQKKTFGYNDPIAMVAYFAKPAGTSHLTRVLTRVGKGEAVVFATTVQVKNPKHNVIAIKASAADLRAVGVRYPGHYVVRYLRGTATLAEGDFFVTAK